MQNPGKIAALFELLKKGDNTGALDMLNDIGVDTDELRDLRSAIKWDKLMHDLMGEDYISATLSTCLQKYH